MEGQRVLFMIQSQSVEREEESLLHRNFDSVKGDAETMIESLRRTYDNVQ